MGREGRDMHNCADVQIVEKLSRKKISQEPLYICSQERKSNPVKKKSNPVKKDSVKKETIQAWNTKVKKLTFQGDFLKLLIDEEENATWKSFSNNIPKGVLSFTLKEACSNGLNTPRQPETLGY